MIKSKYFHGRNNYKHNKIISELLLYIFINYQTEK